MYTEPDGATDVQPNCTSSDNYTVQTSDLRCITNYLRPLPLAEIISVGVELGLDYSRLKRMSQESLVEDMVHSWLSGDDNAEERTWCSLIKALEATRHKGIASKIVKGKFIA